MFKRKKKKVEGNQKVRNATKVLFTNSEGIEVKLDSKLELYFFKLCDDNNIKLEREPKFTLQPKFEYLNEKIREINMFPDSFLPDYNTIVEVKGQPNEVFPIKRKMLLFHLYLTGKDHKYVVLRNKKEILDYVTNLKCQTTY